MRNGRLRAVLSLALFGIVLGLAACSDTWRGLRQDTGENVEATGRAVERAGERVKP
jgi:predicted small secreted protein